MIFIYNLICRWSAIAAHLPKRTDNEIKNYWNTRLKKRLTTLGIDPITHRPQNLALNCYQSKERANISHMAQWESARLQAEARLVREAKLISNPYHYPHLAVTSPAPPPGYMPPRPPCLDILKVWEWTNPGKDISSMVLSGFSPSDAENMLPATAGGFPDGASLFAGVDSVGKPYRDRNEARGIMGNSMELYHANYVDQVFLGFPSFIDGLDLPPDVVSGPGNSNNFVGGCWGVLEESKANCWSNMGSPTF